MPTVYGLLRDFAGESRNSAQLLNFTKTFAEDCAVHAAIDRRG